MNERKLNMTSSVIGRVEKQEPAALIPGLVVPMLMAITLFFHLNDDVQSAVDAVLMAAGGFIVMTMVDWRKSLPLLTGLAKAVFSLIAGLGLDMNPSVQIGVFAVISAVVGWWTSTQVEAKPVGR
jgi:hypothetical protein